LLPITVDDGLFASEHQVDHNSGHVPERVIVFLVSSNDVVGDKIHILKTMDFGKDL
jgi:hypothetical protein